MAFLSGNPKFVSCGYRKHFELCTVLHKRHRVNATIDIAIPKPKGPVHMERGRDPSEFPPRSSPAAAQRRVHPVLERPSNSWRRINNAESKPRTGQVVREVVLARSFASAAPASKKTRLRLMVLKAPRLRPVPNVSSPLFSLATPVG